MKKVIDMFQPEVDRYLDSPASRRYKKREHFVKYEQNLRNEILEYLYHIL